MKNISRLVASLCLVASAILTGCGGSSSIGTTTTTPPAVTSISPTTVMAGSGPLTLTVNGTGFQSTTTIQAGDVAEVTSYVSATEVTATLTAEQLASGGQLPIIALNGTASSGSGTAINLSVTNPAPVISLLTPTVLTTGGAPATLAVTGTGFVPTTVVDVNGSGRATVFESATQVDVTLTATDMAAVGSLSLTAVNGTPGGGTSTAATVAINNPAPGTAIALIPSSTQAGAAAATTVTVTGTNFIPASTVQVNGAARTTTYVSATQVTFQLTVADQATAQLIPVTVVNPTPGGGSSLAVTLTVANPAPGTSITLAPTTVAAGSTTPTSVTVTGTNFVSSSSVQVNGFARSTTFVSATQLTFQLTVNDEANGQVIPVTVRSPAPGGGTSGSANITINNPPPTISQALPTTVVLGAVSPVVALVGTGFVPTTVIDVNGQARLTVYVSATQVEVTLTAADVAATGSLSLTAVNGTPGGGTSTAMTVAVNNPVPGRPISLSPSSVAIGATTSTTITVTGTNFIPTSTVQVSGAARTTTYVSATQVTFQLTVADQATAQLIPVTVVNPTPGGGSSLAATLTVANAAPGTSIALAPNSVTAGTTTPTIVTVTGTNFVSSSSVQVNGVARSTTFVSATQLTFQLTVSDEATAQVLPVTVTSPGPGGGTSGSANVTINNPAPTISQALPTTVVLGAVSPVVALVGTGFVPTTVIDVNGQARLTVYVSATQVEVTLTAADVAATGSLSLTAVNGTPGGGTSPATTVAVNNPAPGPISLSPSMVATGATTPTTITVSGTHFIPASTIQLGGFASSVTAVAVPTTYVSSTQLTFALTVTQQLTAQQFIVSVVNPAPGGGTFSGGVLTVYQQMPTPVITQVSPTQFLVGTGGTTITVSGTNLFPQSGSTVTSSTSNPTVLWNGTALTNVEECTGCSGYPYTGESLIATVPASLLTATGTATITVNNPESSSSLSNALTVTIANPPVPILTSISPNSGPVNTTATVTLNGTGFAPDSTVVVNGTNIPTTYISSTQLYATIPASDLASPGTVNLTVTTAPPGGGTSAALPFTAYNPPAPTITQLYPAGSPMNTTTPVTIYGTGFAANSTVALNGNAISSQFVNSTQLTVTILASAIAVPGNVNLTVTTPSPGGGASAPVPFTAYISITNNDIVYNPTDGLIYASVPGTVAGIGNSVVGLDPVTGNVTRQIWVGSNPNKVALSTDGTQLFVGLDGAGAVAQVNLSAGTVVSQFSVGTSNYNGIITALYLATVPGLPNSVAVTNSNNVLTIYDSGIARANNSSSVGYNYYGPICFGSSASTMYVANYGIYVLTVGPSGFTAGSTLYTSNTGNTVNSCQYDSGQIYLPDGVVVSAVTGKELGTFYATASSAATGPIVSDSTLGLAFVASGSYTLNGNQVLAFSESTFNPTGSIVVNGANSSNYPSGFEKIVRWGQDGVALNTTTQIFLFQSSVVQNLSSSPADLSAALTAPATATTGTSISYVAAVNNAGPNQALDATLALTLDSSLIINSVTPSQGTCGTGNTFSCDLGNLASGSSATVTVSATPTTSGTIAGTASVTSVSVDPTLTNNQATTTTTVSGSFYGMVPSVSAISPPLVQAGSGTFTLTVTGNGFNSASTVNLNGTALSTEYMSATELTAAVNASAITNYGWAPVTVTNPSPGGGTSAVAPLTIYGVVNVPANSIIFDPFSQQIYASLPSAATTLTGNSIVAINPFTAAVGTPVLVGSEPNPLAETSDGEYLYVGLTGSDSLAKFDLIHQQLVATFPLSISQYGSTSNVAATALAAMPGTDATLAIFTSSPYGSTGIYDISGSAGAFRTSLASGTGPVFADPTHLYTSTGSGIYRYSVGSTGATLIDQTSLNGFGVGGSFELADGIAYGGNGGIANPSTTPPSQIATLPLIDFYGSGDIGYADGSLPDPSTQKDFLMMVNDAGTWAFGLVRYSTADYLPEASLTMPASNSSVYTSWSMLRFGQDGIALLSTGNSEINSGAVTQILLLSGPFVTPQLLTTNTAAALTSSSETAITHGAGNALLTLTGSNFVSGVAVTWNGSYRTTTIVDATHVTVAIPAGDLASAGSGSLVATNPGAPASNALIVTIN